MPEQWVELRTDIADVIWRDRRRHPSRLACHAYGMSETTAAKWLTGRRQRRARAVDSAYGMLGLEHGRGKGHLDSLYLQAYQDGLRDAYAFTAQLAQDWLNQSHGRFDVDYLARHAEEQESPG
jgi:hypothetical protein